MMNRIQKFPTSQKIEDVEKYMDTMIKFAFKCVHKDRLSNSHIVYYPSYYLYRSDMNPLTDNNHIDNYKLVQVIVRKITNNSTLITVKQEGMWDSDWRGPKVSTVFNRVVDMIKASIDKYFEQGINIHN